MLTVRYATQEDVASIVPRLRKADLREIHAVGYKNPEESLLVGLHSPDGCYVAVDAEGVPQIIFGTFPSPEHFVGYAWLMATESLKDHWVQVLRETRKWLDFVRGHYKVFTNIVHKENTVHVRWLCWAGFTLIREVEYNGNHFYEFAKLTTTEVS